MNFNKFLKSIFGDKSKRDMRLIQPLVEKVKEAYPDIAKLSNDELRAFNQIAFPILSKIDCNRYENVSLSSFRDRLLPKLMSGELDVSNIDL